MSPVFCAVAKRPSSEPVRREYDATSGVLADDLLDRADLAIGFCQRAACRRQVVEDEAAFIGSREESGAHRVEQRRPSATASTMATQPRAAGRSTTSASRRP